LNKRFPALTQPRTTQETERLLHELQVHQIELEMQNESLLDAQTAIEAGQRFTDLYQFAPMAYFSIGRDSTISLFNQSGARLLNIDGTELIGQRLDTLIDEASLAVFNTFLDKIFALGTIDSCELKLRPAGVANTLDVHVQGISDLTGEVCNLAVTDITERKRLEEIIRRRDQYQRALLDNIPCLVWLKDEQSRFLAVNTPFASAFGWPSPGALIGKTDFGVVPPELAESYRATDLRVLESGQGQSIEEIIETGGERRWFETYKSPVSLDGRIIGTVGFARDITEYRLAERALRESKGKFREQSRRLAEVIWATNSGTWEWNVQTGDLVCNQRWAEIIGYGLAELQPLTIQTYRGLVHPDDLASSRSQVQDCFDRVADTYECEIRLRHKQGHWVWVLNRGRVVEWTTNGKPLRMSGTHQDISLRKAAEAALQVAKAEAERANHAKSRFLAAASHDLRQPLSTLGLYVGVLKSRLGAKETILLNNMASCVSSLNELLSDLLDISKLDAGVVQPEISDFSVTELLLNLISVHAPEAQIKGLSLRWLSAEINGRTDSILFKRMLGNLLANAIRYTERGGVLIACRRHQGKHWIEVWDTGAGIPEDKLDEIFEEFKQLGDDVRNRGSGLGLAIVRKTAALLGLEIRVRSRLGRGSMFAIELPLGKKAHKALASQRQEKERSLRIALVDDNAGVLNALVCALEVIGHQVVAATTGKELITLLDGQAPDIVISDYRLAGRQTGFDVIAAVRNAFDEKLPALLITGDTDPIIMRSMADRGILVQHKPLEIETLQLCIMQATKRQTVM
jgi:PAS domain S-box-containing protein